MKVILDKEDLEIIKEAEELTMTNYKTNNEVDLETLMIVIRDLIYQYNCLDEEFEDYKKNIDDNYTQNSNEYDYTDYRNDF